MKTYTFNELIDMRLGNRKTFSSGKQHAQTVGRTVILEIERRKPGAAESYRQCFSYTVRNAGDTVAAALREINSRPGLTDTKGNPAEPVLWESSCLQKKCGACAMLINGKPQLACDSFLRELPEKICLAPLRKFPLIGDLQVDRSVMQKNLREIRLWMEQPAELWEETAEDAYDASRCLQCGLCLEVCPNFAAEGSFTGAAAAVPAARILAAQPGKERTELKKQYRKRIYEGCGKSLACRDICPAGIDTGERLAQSNAAAVWNRIRRRPRR